MKVYIATGLGNVEKYRRVRACLHQLGHQISFDWDEAGPVDQDSNAHANLAWRARKDLEGVLDASVLIAILPGGRGTHVELGAALAKLDRGHAVMKLCKRAVFLWAEGGLEQYEEPYACVFHHDARIHLVEGDLGDLVAAVEAWYKRVRPDIRTAS